MSASIVAFFNNKGGVGKTSLVYHLAWMYSELGKRVVTTDLDPQANLSAAFLAEDRLEELWPDGDHPKTIFGCVQPLVKGTGDIADPHIELVSENLALLVGDLALSSFEDELSSQWPNCLDGKERSFRVISAFWRTMRKSAETHQADILLMDLGPNLGAINRAALIAADYVVVPLSPDLFSLQGLRNLGPTLRRWREEWRARLQKKPQELALPSGKIQPVGYIVLQHSVRLDRPVKAYDRWAARIPETYKEAVLAAPKKNKVAVAVKDDPQCLALLKHYRSLMPMAQEAHVPMFNLKPADGAIGSHYQAVQNVRSDFEVLARKIAQKVDLPIGC